MLKDIKRMTAELTDKGSAECIEISGLSFRHKYITFSASSYILLMRLIYMAESLFYKAKNLKDAVNYKNGWKIHIHILSSMNNESLINLAVTYLKGKIKEFWINNYVPIKTWNKYMK